MALKIFIEGEKYLVSYGCGHSTYNDFEELVEGLRKILVPSKQSQDKVNAEQYGENRTSEGSQTANIYKEERTVWAALPSTPTPTCPECGSTRIRIVYKDDDATEVNFYDCTICSTVFLPTKNVPPNRNPVKHIYGEKEDGS